MKAVFLSIAVLLWVGSATAARCQITAVPSPNSKGDFSSALMPGNRGNVYQTRKWLVVDPDPTYLNCRYSPTGQVRSRIAPGAIVTAAFTGGSWGDAIVMSNGVPWLRITGTDPLILGDRGECYVRANLRYVAPISEDAILGLQSQ